MSSARKVNNLNKVIQPVEVERIVDEKCYSFKLSVPSRGPHNTKRNFFKVSFQVTPKEQQTPKELTSAVLNDLSVLFQTSRKVKNVVHFETIEIDKTVGYWVNCTVDLSGITPDKFDEKLVSLCNYWLQTAKKNMVVNRVEDHILTEE